VTRPLTPEQRERHRKVNRECMARAREARRLARIDRRLESARNAARSAAVGVGPQSEEGLRVEAALVELERIVARLTARVAHAA
jgi:hypothetical protein